MKRKPKGTIWSKKAKLLSTLLAVTLLCTTVFSGFVWAAETDNDASAVQIGNYYQVNDETGALPDQPELQQNETNLATEQSYEDGKVKVNKTISPTSEENVFDVTLTVKTQEDLSQTIASPDVATVIVIDASYSMTNNGVTRLADAKKAAQTFINNYVDSNAARKVAIVKFSGYPEEKVAGAVTVQDWTDASTLLPTNGNALCDKIAGIQSDGGTCTEAGLLLAKNLLKQKLYNDDGVEITNKNLIILTDGHPTYGVASTEESSTSTSVICQEGNNIVGDGKNTQHGNRDTHKGAEREAAAIRAAGVSTYAIYVGNQNVDCKTDRCDLNTTGENWLANYCGFTTYSTEDSSQLTSIFETILNVIELRAQAWIVTDPMGAYIDFVEFKTNANPANEFKAEDGIITWDIKNSARGSKSLPDANGVTTTTYQMTYRIKLDTLAEGFKEETYYATNGVTKTTYLLTTTEDGVVTDYVDGTACFNIPSVMGYKGDFSFDKIESFDEPLAGATFRLTAKEDSNWYREVTSEENGVISFNGIPSGHKYTLEEISAPTGYTKSNDKYTVVVSYGEVTIYKGDSTNEEDKVTDLKVKNESKKIEINGEKTWEDGEKWAKTHRPESIKVTLTGYVDDEIIVNPIEKTITPNEAGEWKWSFTDLPKYWKGEQIDYSIGEVKVPGYRTDINGFNITNVQIVTDVTISKEVTGFFGDTNKPFNFKVKAVDKDGNLIDLKDDTYEGYTIENDIISFDLKHEGNIVIENLPLGATLIIDETNAAGYETSFAAADAVNPVKEENPSPLTVTVADVEKKDEIKSGSIEISDGLAVKVINDKEGIVDVGVILDNMPYIIMLQITLIGAILFILRRRNLEENE